MSQVLAWHAASPEPFLSQISAPSTNAPSPSAFLPAFILGPKERPRQFFQTGDLPAAVLPPLPLGAASLPGNLPATRCQGSRPFSVAAPPSDLTGDSSSGPEVAGMMQGDSEVALGKKLRTRGEGFCSPIHSVHPEHFALPQVELQGD